MRDSNDSIKVEVYLSFGHFGFLMPLNQQSKEVIVLNRMTFFMIIKGKLCYYYKTEMRKGIPGV